MRNLLPYLRHGLPDQVDHLQTAGSDGNFPLPVPVDDQAIPGVSDKGNCLEIRHQRTRRLDGIRKRHFDDIAGYAIWQSQPSKIDLVYHREDDRDFRPQFRTPTQHQFEGRSPRGYDNADWDALILLLEMSLQERLVVFPAESVEIEAFGVERDVRSVVGAQHRAQS